MTEHPKKLTPVDILSRTRDLTTQLETATAEHEALALRFQYGEISKEAVEQSRKKREDLSNQLEDLRAAAKAADREADSIALEAERALRAEIAEQAAQIAEERKQGVSELLKAVEELSGRVAKIAAADRQLRLLAAKPGGLDPAGRRELGEILGIHPRLADLIRVAFYRSGLGEMGVVPEDWKFAPIDVDRDYLIELARSAVTDLFGPAKER